MNKNKNLAFTLAEVLIVIGIIGVVAALTLPNLNHATGDKERVTKVKKIYSALTEAFDRAQAVYGDYNTWFNTTNGPALSDAQKNERIGKRITEFMKISKVCGLEINEGCFTTGSFRMLWQNTPYSDVDASNYSYKVINADGMSISFGGGDIKVDIDGPNKGPYVLGKDMFTFVISSDNSMINLPNGGPCSAPFNCGYSASRWIIENDNADYLQADSTGKCNDSNIVLDGVTNTSCH